MTTLGDLAKRLYDKFAATQELLEPKSARFQPTRWEELPEWRQEVWVTIAAEAVKVGAEIQQEIERDEDERLVNHPDFVDIPTAEEDEEDEAPKLREIANSPRRFVRLRRDRE